MKVIHITGLCWLLTAVISHQVCYGQDDKTPSPLIGIYGGGLFNTYEASFRKLPGVPNCCTEFGGERGFDFSAGAAFYLFLSQTWSIQFRAAYERISLPFQRQEQIGKAIIGDTRVPIVSEFTLDPTLTEISFKPLLQYALLGSLLYLDAGPSLGYLVQTTFTQQERLLEPAGVTFLDGTVVRNYYAGDIPQVQRLQLGVSIGIHSELWLSKSIRLVPELLYTYRFTPIVRGLHWYAANLYGGFGLVVRLPRRSSRYTSYFPDRPPPPPPALIVGLGYKVAGTGPQKLDIDIERIHEHDIIPILPHVYFPAGAATLQSTAMVLLDKESVSKFDINRLPMRTMDVYHNLLNIVGYRMRKNGTASLTLIGTSSQSPGDRTNPTIGLDRAEAVKRYLVSTWGIEPSRIHAKGRGLPEHPTATDIPDGQEENARVELYSENAVLLDPVEINNTQAVVGASQVTIIPTLIADEGVKSWSISIKQGDRLIGLYKGEGVPPSYLTWTPDIHLLSAQEQQVVMELSVTDNLGRTSSAGTNIPVDIHIREREQESVVGKIRRDRLQLILFDFNSAELKSSHARYIRDIINRIDKKSSVIISGYTDYIGSSEYNMKLSFERSRAVFDLLKPYVSPRQVVLNPHGSRNAPYSNALPEGRAYNRTVIITVETPMEK